MKIAVLQSKQLDMYIQVLYNLLMKRARILTAFRLTAEAKKIIEDASQKLGVSQADIVEMAIRKFAQAEGVEQPPKK